MSASATSDRLADRPCPICAGQMEIVFDQHRQCVLVCLDCQAGLTVPDGSAEVTPLKRDERWQLHNPPQESPLPMATPQPMPPPLLLTCPSCSEKLTHVWTTEAVEVYHCPNNGVVLRQPNGLLQLVIH
jgi:ribosomal protein S27E